MSSGKNKYNGVKDVFMKHEINKEAVASVNLDKQEIGTRSFEELKINQSKKIMRDALTAFAILMSDKKERDSFIDKLFEIYKDKKVEK